MSKRDSLGAEALRAALGEPYIGREVAVVEEATSTNDLAWQMAQEGKPDGLVVMAERQTAGRGQRGNRWESAAHLGLWLSILLRPGLGPADSARLTNWAAQTTAQTINEQSEAVARIKMPNDIYILERKVAGVLVEMRVEKNGAYAAIVGIGVNVNQAEDDFSETVRASAGSLAMAAGKQIDRQAFAFALLQNLDQSYRALFTA
jgi:BirA family transcriptional regulator, biotin operon repressor / biotin---[acetyl-CoA-carboxylase] ligase